MSVIDVVSRAYEEIFITNTVTPNNFKPQDEAPLSREA